MQNQNEKESSAPLRDVTDRTASRLDKVVSAATASDEAAPGSDVEPETEPVKTTKMDSKTFSNPERVLCKICKHPLTGHKSRIIHMGPVCAFRERIQGQIFDEEEIERCRKATTIYQRQ